MSEQPSSPATPDDAPISAPSTPSESDGETQLAERPEVRIGAAFVGGFALALLLRRLAG